MTNRQKIKNAPKYTLFIDGAGFLSSTQGMTGVKFTKGIQSAMLFAVGYDQEETKKEIWNAAAKRMFNANVTFEIMYL